MKSKKTITTELLRNPKYSSSWIDAASDILASEKNTFDIKKLEEFNGEQLAMIKDAIEGDIVSDINKLAVKELNATQMQMYIIGIQKGIPEEKMDIFLNPNIPYAKSNYILNAMVEGNYDLINYISFSPDQIFEIYAGYKDSVDYKSYANESITSENMALIRHALKFGKDISLTGDGAIIIK